MYYSSVSKKIKGGGWQKYTLDPSSLKMEINSLWETSCAMRERFCSVFFHCEEPFCQCGGGGGLSRPD